jgi:SAM-dependent methyltransferase
MSSLQAKGQKLARRGIFTGGPVHCFEAVGRSVFIFLLENKLMPESRVLDVGCGCLRVGYWLINFLDSGCYFGIEPNETMLSAGIEELLEPELLKYKRPRFDSTDQFDFSVFDNEFDFVLARSVWTHASLSQIRAMLDGFASTAADNGVFFTSYLRASWRRKAYVGESWVGRSHESDAPGMVRHRFEEIRRECFDRELLVEEMPQRIRNQIWLRITKVR